MFSSITGQKRIKRIMTAAIEGGQISHAYLLAGANVQETEKMAEMFASAILCTAETKDRPCGQCSHCRAIAAGHFPDLMIVRTDEGARTIKIRQIRDLIGQIAQQSFDGNMRVSMILHSEMMTTEAQNALLKSLEEPAQGNVFLLTTDNPERVLPTIRSRCQLLMLEDATEDDGDSLFETIKEEAFLVICDILDHHPDALFSFSERMGKDRENSKRLTDSLIRLFEKVLCAEKTGMMPRPSDEKVMDLIQRMVTGQAETFLTVLFELSERMQYNINLRLQWERTLLKLFESTF